jgi:pimeloyl-ACP methyl ester carboxylesterase
VKIAFLILWSVLLCSNLCAQPFQIGHRTITLTDTSRNFRNIPAEVYYPADAAGNNVPVTTATNDKFPVLTFGHGFVMAWDAYQNIWEALVPEGFIIAFPKTETGFSPSHSELGKDIAFVISQLTALGLNNSSFLYNRVDSMNCVMGHSMGGGSAFLAAQYSPAVKALATLAPAETNPSAIQAAASLGIPALIFAGGNDCVTPPPANQIPMYDSLQSICKTYISIDGGSHCQMADYNFMCSFGESTCTPQPTITRSEQHIILNRYLLPWLKYELKGDCPAGALFDSLIATDTGIDFQKTFVLCNTTSLNENSPANKIEVYPNPFCDQLFIQCSKSAGSKVVIDLYLMNGTKIHSQMYSEVKANETLKLYLAENLPSGIYFLKATFAGQQCVWKIIRK